MEWILGGSMDTVNGGSSLLPREEYIRIPLADRML